MRKARAPWRRAVILKPLDIPAFALSFGLVVVIGLSVYAGGQHSDLVQIKSPAGEWLFPLAQDREFQDAGPEGTCIISIADRAVRVVESACPNKICIKTGSIRQAGQWIACLPHQVFIQIKGEKQSQADATSF